MAHVLRDEDGDHHAGRRSVAHHACMCSMSSSRQSPAETTDGQCDYSSGHASLVSDMHSGGSERLHHHDLQQGHAANSSHAAHLSTMARDRATSAWL